LNDKTENNTVTPGEVENSTGIGESLKGLIFKVYRYSKESVLERTQNLVDLQEKDFKMRKNWKQWRKGGMW
jgi:hypothetical protein